MPDRSRRRSPFPAALAFISVVTLLATAVTPSAGSRPATGGPLTAARPAVAVAVAPRTDAGVLAAAPDPTKVALNLTLLKGGFNNPVLVTSARDGSNRLFVVEQRGVIKIISGGNVLPTPFLDISPWITYSGESGLLGLAFHPQFATNHFVYIDFVDRQGRTGINRYKVSANANVLDFSSGVRLLSIVQPYPNHKGGNIAFGPDGFLYIGMGDGGSGGDPQNRAQDLGTLLGKMLRIDVDHPAGTRRYSSPASNPFAATTGLDEIWARGLRNPWRWSFDRLTGALWIGDVGQANWEEVDRSTPAGGHLAGWAANYGWVVLEGFACYRPATGCKTIGKTPPLLAYPHPATTVTNCAVTGGFVYRGSAYPVLAGIYLFADFCSGRIWGVSAGATSPATPTLLRSPTQSPRPAISSFGEDQANELYVVDRGGGAIYRVSATVKP